MFRELWKDKHLAKQAKRDQQVVKTVVRSGGSVCVWVRQFLKKENKKREEPKRREMEFRFECGTWIRHQTETLEPVCLVDNQNSALEWL